MTIRVGGGDGGGGGVLDLVKGDVGLGNVDNTADVAKPVSTAQAAADAAVQAYAVQRSNHTGTQTSATVSDFTEAVQDAVAALLGAGTNITVNYDDAANTLTIATTAADAEAVRDAIGVALVGVGNISIGVNDAADTITISTTATANSTDAALRDRSTHTGTQPISSVTGLQAAIIAATAVDATTSAKGIVQLAGDLAGTAASPTVPGKEPLSAGLLGRRRERPIPFLVRELMANPPVVGATVSATAITSPQSFYALTGGGGTGSPTVDASAPFTYLGAGSVAAYGTTSPNWNYVVFNSVSGSGISPSAPYRVRFGFDGTQLEILFKQLSGYGWELWVDGQLVAAPAASGSSPTSAMLPVTFSTRKPRVIEFRSQLPFRGVNVGPNDTVWAVASPGPRVIVPGDSYVQGTGGTIPGLTGFVQTFGDIMGWSDVWPSGVGGTGYLNPGSVTKLGDRLAADVTSRSPDLVILAMGHNDTGYSAGTLTAEVASVCTAVKAALNPGGKLIVLGPLFQGGSASSYTAVQTAIFAGAAGIADGTVDTVTSPWFTGTGKAGATTGSGNSDLYISSDGVHPTQAGHDYLARRLSAAVNNLLAA